MNIFVGMLPVNFSKLRNGLPWKQCNFTLTNQFIIEEHNVLPLSDLIESFDMNKNAHRSSM